MPSTPKTKTTKATFEIDEYTVVFAGDRVSVTSGGHEIGSVENKWTSVRSETNEINCRRFKPQVGDANRVLHKVLKGSSVQSVSSAQPAFEQAISGVFDHILQSSQKELYSTPENELVEKYWQFRVFESKSPEWNLYRFSEHLERFKRNMRRWEEHHNGNCCVVERVRDKYLLPRIKEFIAETRSSGEGFQSIESIIKDANDLARRIYASMGCQVDDDFKFYEASHPQEVGCWTLATIAYDHLQGTELDDVLAEFLEEGSDGE